MQCLCSSFLSYCFMSTEARWPIRDGVAMMMS